ncbi:hypothetical protein [Nocardia brasiliensis]|uniref:hypothetical protein n=1 Tax=Nocardia brasiliensis TaxID=37326 RepID=UPI001E2A1FD0|nr:hypothetical protein [Nocardia brasiliensis]
MTAVRLLLLVAGGWLGWYGITLLLDFPQADLISIALWFAGGILLHDAVFAPLCAAAGITARRFLPGVWWGPAACGAVCTVALLAIAAPVLDRGHAMPDNPTVLDRNYLLGLMAAVVLVWVLVGAAGAAKLVDRRRRRDTTTQRSTP